MQIHVQFFSDFYFNFLPESRYRRKMNADSDPQPCKKLTDLLLLSTGVRVAQSPVSHIQPVPVLVPVVLEGHREVALQTRHRVHQQVVH